ncbi:phospholipase D family protein [Pontibacter sp. MBLB2868]|uniref:phospholipase D family protein n=1 Tax=Pontibacter sp. MBLB2868 TaxID=3451555 RepID=UPI003F75344D
MSEFITTKGIAYHIEELVKRADKEITLVTPYLKIAPLLLERIMEHDRKGCFTTIIYGKDELRADQKLALSRLNNLNLYFAKNLHAKCYYNEKQLLITSMNLYEFSENNNREFGIVVDAKKERYLYQEVVKEVESIKASAELQQQNYKPKEEISQQTAYNKYEYKELMEEVYKVLKKKYPFSGISWDGDALVAENFLDLNIDLTNRYGFATITLHNDDYDVNRRYKQEHFDKLYQELPSYRIYWSSPYDIISLYHQKNIEFMDIQDDVRYCIYGIETLVNTLRKLQVVSKSN